FTPLDTPAFYSLSLHDALPILITIFSALRLAKFNLDERQTTDFIGVNTPMNTFLVVSLPFLAELYPTFILNAYFLIALTVISSRSEEHTSELQSRENLVCRLLL